jgi:hypothetical protein
MNKNLLIALFASGLFYEAISNKGAKTQPKNINTMPNELTETDLNNAFKQLQSIYGYDVARYVEKIYRLETGHFKSLGFKMTNGAGALVVKGRPNYGWGNIDFTKYGMSHTWTYNGFEYLAFDTLQGALNFLADYLVRNSANNKGIEYAVQRWGSSPNYLTKVNGITNKFII